MWCAIAQIGLGFGVKDWVIVILWCDGCNNASSQSDKGCFRGGMQVLWGVRDGQFHQAANEWMGQGWRSQAKRPRISGVSEYPCWN
jgi:hypothetical protein